MCYISGVTTPGPQLSWDMVIDLSAQPSAPLYQQLTRAIRDAIRDGRVPGGAALPPSRALAAELGVSRATVTEAYGQLIAEGYLESRPGSTTRARPGLTDQPPTPEATDPLPETHRTFRFDLRPGIPDLRAFPRTAWAEAVRRAVTALENRDLAGRYPFGHPRARASVASYLRRSRDAAAVPEHTFIVQSASAGMALLTQALRGAGKTAIAVENPSWPQLRDICRRGGLRSVPFPVDEDGMQVEQLDEHPEVGVVLLTPAHQFPTGVVLAPERRARLLDWARERDGLLIEDDYDASFRYDRRQIAALQGMGADRVALLGSLSKTLSPAVGMGWMVLPPAWSDAVTAAAPELGTTGVLDSLTLAEFIDSGRYDQQLRMLRQRYRSRRDVLVAALHRRLPDLQISGLNAGLHLVLNLPEGVDVADLIRRAHDADVGLVERGRYAVGDAGPPGSAGSAPPALVLGYGNLRDSLVPEAVTRLAALLRVDPRR